MVCVVCVCLRERPNTNLPPSPTHPSPHPHLAAAAAATAARTVSSPEVSAGPFPFTRSFSEADRRAPRHGLVTVSAAAAEDAEAGAGDRPGVDRS